MITSNQKIVQKGKTWANFDDAKDDVEKQEFTVIDDDYQNDLREINSKQSDVFLGSFKTLNLFDQLKREMVEKYLILPKPEVFHWKSTLYKIH